MPKTIIVIRHGESESDKNNPYRRLTPVGKSQIAESAKKIKELMGNSGGQIVTTQTTRTIQTATILSKILEFPVKETRINLRVENFGIIEERYPKSKNLTFKYFEDFKNGKLDPTIPAPTQIAGNFLKVIGKFENELIIIVSHGAALESFVLYQSTYKTNKVVNNELNYGEFIVLNEAI